MGQGLSIEMFPARHGDALWIEWDASDGRRRMLIDGGPARTADLLRQRFDDLDPSERRVDLLVVTHIDLDHVDGIIRLLDDRPEGLEVGDVWFNDHHHLPGSRTKRGAIQGEFLGAQLETLGLPWNLAFGGGAVVVPDEGLLPRIKLDGGVDLVVLSPTSVQLAELRDKWEDTLADERMEPGDRAAALALLDQRLGRTDRGGRAKFGGDGSAANGSSIALVLEHAGERWLLAGDAHEDVLVAGIRRYAREVGDSPVRLDGFKLPHHGSVKNMSRELLDAITCRRFLVSTSGAYFKHPDQACLDLIVERSDRPELVFNYRSAFTEPWTNESDAYTARFPDDPDEAIHARPTDRADRATEPAQPAVPAEPTETGVAPTGAVGGAGPTEDATRDETASDDTAPDETAIEGRPADAQPPPPETIPLHVSVVHGSLERARFPVMVGHYVATPLEGAEKFIDHRFDQRLTDRFAMGRYPGPIGSWTYVAAPPLRHPAHGTLVVGLGEFGELTPLELVETVRVALVEHALDQADQHAGPDRLELGVSSLLLSCSGDQGMRVEGAVLAIIDAVSQANRMLTARPEASRVVYRRLEFIERNGPQAELAFRVLQEPELTMRQRGGDDRVGTRTEINAASQMKRVSGALSNSVPVDTGARQWWRVRVRDVSEPPAPGSSEPRPYLDLEYTVGGNLARTGQLVHRVERRRLERILRDAVGTPKPDADIHATLFELLFPNELKWELVAAQDVQLEVDATTADIPWEMLQARDPEEGTRSELALRARLVRQLRLPAIPTVRRSSRPNALVIGNPPTGSLAPTLAGAFEEATTVAELLRVDPDNPRIGYSVTELCTEPGTPPSAEATGAIENALFQADYRIIHIAAHGFFDPDNPIRSGVAIGPDDFLTTTLLKQVPVVPDLVFLNCCHLGAVRFGVEASTIEFTRQHLNQLGASIARQLIDAGVRAVVAAGWAVDDHCATLFARSFYAEMLAGSTFGEAVFDARNAAWKESKRVHQQYPDDPPDTTWGAYQCYGDSGYQLPRDAGTRVRQSEAHRPPRTIREALRRLEELHSQLESDGIDGALRADRLLGELDVIEAEVTKRWAGGRQAGELCEELGRVAAAAQDYPRAIRWYRRGLTTTDAGMSLKGIEQLANLLDRHAASTARRRRLGAEGEPTPDETVADLDELYRESVDLLDLLDRLRDRGGHVVAGSGSAATSARRDTWERAALRAGQHKRRAVAVEGADREAEIEKAAACYLQSYELDPDRVYGLLNHVQLGHIRALLAGTARSTDQDEALARVIEELRTTSPTDYWSAVGRADAALTEAIVSDAVAERVSGLADAYREAFARGSTASQRASTLDHLLDLADLHPEGDQRRALHRLHAELDPSTVSTAVAGAAEHDSPA